MTMDEMSDADVLRAEEELRRAMVAGDVEALDRLIDDTLIFVSLTGDVVSKEDDLAAHRAHAIRIDTLDPSDRHIAIHGDSAVVSVLMHATGTFHGEAFDSRLRYTRFWRQHDGGWRIVGGHMSAVS